MAIGPRLSTPRNRLHSTPKAKHTDGSVFGPDVVDHDGGHNQGDKVDDQGSYFCYDVWFTSQVKLKGVSQLVTALARTKPKKK